ncbi:sterol desaturase family protein [Pelagibaculum spongiae]|uniref:Fatty acid hydroxylase n=1 Tax=Pelagibaculum spongiae TaxID=2080658 RepID=A0A2V1GY33_9GAMM|nr:sterol desaturase family protein [Pelagibaculum spongiae]PVZ66795.1 fatty acid hydroxylase [Pelagibaculum spongiae]
MAQMSAEAMQAFRSKYRTQISQRYSGWLHMGFVSVVGIAVIVYALSQVLDSSWMQWLAFPLTMLGVNFAEYCAHRWLGHRKTSIGKMFYQRHTGDHHSFFLESAMDYQSVADWRVVLFPGYLIIAFLVGLVIPGFLLLDYLFSSNVGFIYAAAGISGYLFYEVMHFSYHIPQGHWVQKIFLMVPGWKQMRHTHVLHHRRDKMGHANFNITLPIFDWLLGTLYWQPLNRSYKSNGEIHQR